MKTILLSVLASALAGPAAAETPTARLAENGRARLPVVIAENACQRVRAAAGELADYLGRISGAAFEVETGDGAAGIVIGRPEDFTALPFTAAFGDGPFQREDYLLRSTGDGLYLLGGTPLGVENAAWDLLNRFGYRYYFPSDTWEIIPRRDTLAIAVDDFQHPDYYGRRIWWTNEAWRRRNRNNSGFSLSTGHAYGGIIRANAEAFREHPEYYALVGGERRLAGRVDGRGNIQFCISNPGLRRLVVDHAVRVMTENPDRDSISMDPSDGSQWCRCAPCAEMGTVSDRVVTLASEVAAAINDLGLGDKYVGIYAYASHSPPPSPGVAVHPHVVVSVATSFVRGGYTAAQLVEEWGARAAVLGIREYYYSYANLPGAGRGSDLSYLRQTIPWFHQQGARFNSANIHGAWHAGFAYYMMAEMMWDVTAAERVEEYFDDFLAGCFGAAAEPMRRFYRIMHRFTPDQRRVLLGEDLLARMYRALAEARALSDDPAVHARLDELVLYTRHAELYHLAVNAGGEERQQLYEDWVAHSYRIAGTTMLHTRRMAGRHYAPGGVTPVDRIEGRARQLREAAVAYTREDIDQLLAAGVAANQLLDFEPVDFSDELVPAAPLGLPAVTRGQFGNAGTHRSTRHYQVWIEEPGPLTVRVRGGITYRNRGPVRLQLFSPLDELGEPVDSALDAVPPDQAWHEVTLTTPHPGHHTLRVSDGDGRHRIQLPEGMPKTLRSGFRAHVGIPRAYFYVPRGTAVVGGYVDAGSGGIWDAAGNLLHDFGEEGNRRGYFNVPVPAGQDGQLWRVRAWRGRGELRLMTVPPWLALSGDELLLPREVVAADAAAADNE